MKISNKVFGVCVWNTGAEDYVIAALFLSFLTYETIADNQQWKFQTMKYKLKGEGKTLTGEYADGFNQVCT